MKIVNRTKYPTKQIRSVLCAVHAFEAKRRGALHTWKDRLVVEITYSRMEPLAEGDIRWSGMRTNYGGWAYYSGRRCRLHVPAKGLDVKEFADVWFHELWHLYGIKHADMPKSIHYAGRAADAPMHILDWLPGKLGFASLDEVLPTRKVKPSVQDKLDALADRERRWLTKHKTATTYLKKIARQRKALQRRLAS